MKPHFNVEDGGQTTSRLAHVGKVRRLVDGKCIRTRKLDQEEVVLNEVILERGLGQGAISQSFCERVFRICAPFFRSIFLEPIEEGHRGLSLSG